MSNDFRPEPQDGFSSYDRDLDDCPGYYAYLNGVDEDEYYDDENCYDDEEDGQPSEYTDWMDFDPNC